MKTLLRVIFLMLVGSACAHELFQDRHGHALPDSAVRKSIDGFSGWLLVTSDADWQAKWETPPETRPLFNEARSASLGEKLFILTFFANPKINDAGEADVSCDIQAVRPDGTYAVHQVDAICFRGVLGSNRHLYLCAPILNFVGEPHDPTGEWQVRVVLKDHVRGVVLPLETSFVLLNE